MQLRLVMRGTVACLQKAFDIRVPLQWDTCVCSTYGQQWLVIRQGKQGERQASLARLWSVEDAWSINDESRLGWYRHTTQRCIMPVSCFRIMKDGRWYEVVLNDGSYMSCVGIWEAWQNDAGLQQEGVVLITTMANVLLAPFQKTMPLILHPSELSDWLQSKRPLKQDLQRLASPYPSELMCVIPLGTSE
ncbi:SOS response-associated peptidase family protein [Trichlorobacter lovleyi]|uniref:SOS response-associated peptidase family protein n=1 Tax=Trichlorobacter lovleyi TaxID=313985 RepID=UPI00223FFA96|nr:SOS response-associated peptidase family protein [Trichlorobacter lovleyi]QOX80394.1 SOS response-associated peptidase family protein [Trichlorobacter lovleyi]